MPKMYQGNEPDLSEGWEIMGHWTDEDRVKWNIFMKYQDHSEEWATYKICAHGKAKAKANYWAVRKNTGQLGYARDMAQMREYRPKLHAFVEKVMNQNQ